MWSRINRWRLITRDILEWTLELFYTWEDARIGWWVGWGEGALASSLRWASSRSRSPCTLSTASFILNSFQGVPQGSNSRGRPLDPHRTGTVGAAYRNARWEATSRARRQISRSGRCQFQPKVGAQKAGPSVYWLPQPSLCGWEREPPAMRGSSHLNCSRSKL